MLIIGVGLLSKEVKNKMENISEVLTSFLSSGPVGVISAAVVYLVIYLQRNKTSEKRDEDTDNLGR